MMLTMRELATRRLSRPGRRHTEGRALQSISVMRMRVAKNLGGNENRKSASETRCSIGSTGSECLGFPILAVVLC